MKFALAILLGAVASAFGAGAALASFDSGPALAQDKQDPDKDAAKKKILEEVEKRLKSEEEKLLKDLEKVIDEELGGKKTEPAKPPVAKPEPAPPRKARAYLGIEGRDLSDDEKKTLNVNSGVKIARVVPDGPAAKGGLKADDVITGIDGRTFDTSQEIQILIQAAGAGTKIKVDYVRDGKKSVAEVTLGRHPQDPPDEAPKPLDPARGKQDDPKSDDLRERVKKFLQKEEAPKQEEPKAEKPKAPPAEGQDDFFAMDEEMFEQVRGLLEQFGMDPEQFFEKGKDGKYRLNSELRELVKGLNLDKFKDLLPGGNKPEPEPAPKKEEPKKVEPKPVPSAPRAWLGLQPEEVSEELRAQLDLEEGVGLLLADVVSGSPAEKAGLKKNDIITKIDGKPAKGETTLATFMESAKPGQEVAFTILRKGKEQTLKATLGERKE